ncbi:MAG: hypothetical protein NVSMB18_35920 [Acetobacteraceae bacterium]
MRNQLLYAAAGGLALATLGAGTAHAVPSYAYARLHFDNFTLSGIVNPDGTPATGINSVSATVISSTGANYPGFAVAGHIDSGGSLTSGTDAQQATSGPGGFPGENFFDPALTPSNTLTPAGTRADVQIQGAIANKAISDLVSEGKLSIGPGSAGSDSGSSTTLSISFKTGASPGLVGLTFNAYSVLSAAVGTFADSANAQVSATFTITDGNGNAVAITDNSTATSSDVARPTALNLNRGTNREDSPKSYSSGSSAYSYSATLDPNQSYTLSLQDNTRILLSTVPEPVSLAVLGSGLIALGVTRLSRKNRA